MVRSDGKSLRVGGDPNFEQDWEVCTIAYNCQRHTHIRTDGKINPQFLNLEEAEDFDTGALRVLFSEYKNLTEDSKEKIDRISENLTAEIEKLLQDERTKERNSYNKRFLLNNFDEMLIGVQNNNAQEVTLESDWAAVGRHPKKGERPIYTLRKGFKIEKLYDASQTEPILYMFDSKEELDEFVSKRINQGYSVKVNGLSAYLDGKPDVTIPHLTGGVPNSMKSFLEHQVDAMDVKVEYKVYDGERNGIAYNTRRGKISEIEIRNDMSEAQTARTLIHELMHVQLGHNNTSVRKDAISTGRREMAAESLAFMLGQYFNFDTSEYSKPYIAEWSFNNLDSFKEVMNYEVLPAFKNIINNADIRL